MKRKAPKVLERHVRLKLQTLLKVKGWFVYYNLQTMGSYVGLSDLTIVKDGVVVWLEIKKPGGKQSPKQIIFQKNIEAAGGNYFVADDWAPLEKYLACL